MKCNLCKENMTANPHVINALYIDYRCKNEKCSSKGKLSYITIKSIDMNVSYYALAFQIENKWYCLTSSKYGTGLYYGICATYKNQIIYVERPSPLNINEDLGQHLEKYYHKLKQLVVFS